MEVTTRARYQSVLAERGITADTVLNRVLGALKLTQDAELAGLFDVSRPTIAAWRKRNRIPFGELLALSFEGKLDFVYCLLGTDLPEGIAAPAVTELELDQARETFSRALRIIDHHRRK
jgi:hypothetical protein